MELLTYMWFCAITRN